MPAQPKPKKVGRPTLPKGEAKGKLVALRLSPDDRKRVEKAAKAQKQSVSDWIRDRMNEDNWNAVLSLFGKARDEYALRGDQETASQCDLSIALAQRIMIELSEWK